MDRNACAQLGLHARTKTGKGQPHRCPACRYTGADLAAAVNEAGLAALTESGEATSVAVRHFQAALQVTSLPSCPCESCLPLGQGKRGLDHDATAGGVSFPGTQRSCRSCLCPLPAFWPHLKDLAEHTRVCLCLLAMCSSNPGRCVCPAAHEHCRCHALLLPCICRLNLQWRCCCRHAHAHDADDDLQLLSLMSAGCSGYSGSCSWMPWHPGARFKACLQLARLAVGEQSP